MKIDLFMPQMSQYNVLHHFTIKLYEALIRQHQNAHLLTLQANRQLEFLNKILSHSPDLTFTFNSVAPDSQGAFLCDLLKIPHLSWLVDSSNILFMQQNMSLEALRRSDCTFFATVDRDSCSILQEIGVPRVFFLPHAVERELFGCVSNERPYDVTMLASPIDYENIRVGWEREFPDLKDLLQESALLSIQNPKISYFRALAKILGLTDVKGKISDQIVQYKLPLCALERYLRGLDRVNVVKSIRSARVHVYGSVDQGHGWDYYLREKSNAIIHEAVSFEEAFDIMKKSKIVLNSCSWIRDGGHERIFSAMACGALVITTRTPFLEESFIEGEEILFYDLNQWEIINTFVAYYLNNEEERVKIALGGQKKVHKFHTWDNRAESLISGISLFF